MIVSARKKRERERERERERKREEEKEGWLACAREFILFIQGDLARGSRDCPF